VRTMPHPWPVVKFQLSFQSSEFPHRPSGVRHAEKGSHPASYIPPIHAKNARMDGAPELLRSVGTFEALH
jgi:hypothetical protein